MRYQRARGILIKAEYIAVMERKKGNLSYCSFPGGFVKRGETPEQCIVRELDEELGIKVKPKHLVYNYHWNGEVEAYFVLSWIDGAIQKNKAAQYAPSNAEGTYAPCIMRLDEVRKNNLLPPEIVEQIFIDFKKYGPELKRPLLDVYNRKNP